MNSLSDGNAVPAATAGTLNAFLMPETSVAPFEFRCLSFEGAEDVGKSADSKITTSSGADGEGHRKSDQPLREPNPERFAGHNAGATEAVPLGAVDAARQEGLQQGTMEGHRAARAEMEAEMKLATAGERKRLADSLDQFRGAKDGYFAEVEQEVVRLALAIAARVLHREAQIDPLLLTGAVRVALEKMADRSGVVLRVTGADVQAWEGIFHSIEPSVRPKVVEDSRLERGECVLDTQMGTVELGVHVQLEEIEKGFFDLLNHRPIE